MPKAFPPEFRRDVVAVARKGEAPISQIAKDFGISAPLAKPGRH
jgi:transposase